MSQQYRRLFVTLKNDRPGYEFADRQPSGRCIIETRGGAGKITVTVQDLKPGVLYKGYMIRGAEVGSSGFPVGTISVDAKGKGELKAEFDAENIGKSGLSIGEVNAVAVIVKPPAGQGREQGVVSPLVGYMEELVRWKHGFVDLADQQRPAPERRDVLARVTPAEKAMLLGPFEEYTVQTLDELVGEMTDRETDAADAGEAPAHTAADEHAVEETAAKEAPDVEVSAVEVSAVEVLRVEEPAAEAEAAEATVETMPDETAAAEEATVEQPSVEAAARETETPPNEPRADAGWPEDDARGAADVHEAFKTMAKQFNKELESLEFYALPEDEAGRGGLREDVRKAEAPPKSDGGMGDEIEYVFKHGLGLTPFKRQSKTVEWVCISTKELALLPLDCWSLMNQPFILLAHKKYNHLILGREPGDGAAFCVGVPGQYRREDREHAKALGFARFQCCDDILPADGEYGYWILETK